MIRTEGLSFSYDRNPNPALNSVDLEIREGEYIALIGPNGCGKTTLIKQFNALLLPSRGEVLVDGMNTREKSQLIEIRRRVGMVFQNPAAQIVGMTVEEDVAYGPGNLRLPINEVRQRVDEALEQVGIKHLAKEHPHALSGGQQQLLALAGVLAMRPGYIVLDEPTSSLDPAARNQVLTILHRLVKEGMTIVHVTHDIDEVVEADRVIVMDQGQVTKEGSPAQVFSQVQWLKELGLTPPRVTELMWQLRKLGLPVSDTVLTLDEATQEIKRYTAGLRAEL